MIFIHSLPLLKRSPFFHLAVWLSAWKSKFQPLTRSPNSGPASNTISQQLAQSVRKVPSANHAPYSRTHLSINMLHQTMYFHNQTSMPGFRLRTIIHVHPTHSLNLGILTALSKCCSFGHSIAPQSSLLCELIFNFRDALLSSAAIISARKAATISFTIFANSPALSFLFFGTALFSSSDSSASHQHKKHFVGFPGMVKY